MLCCLIVLYVFMSVSQFVSVHAVAGMWDVKRKGADVIIFLFQAEVGIRVLVRSGEVGDRYKRQALTIKLSR